MTAGATLRQKKKKNEIEENAKREEDFKTSAASSTVQVLLGGFQHKFPLTNLYEWIFL